jgi:hypothetical protein
MEELTSELAEECFGLVERNVVVVERSLLNGFYLQISEQS